MATLLELGQWLLFIALHLTETFDILNIFKLA